MKRCLFLFSATWIFLFSGCRQAPVTPGSLMETDSLFSVSSMKNGYKAAFLAFADSNAVLLKPGYLPIKGRGSIARHFHEQGSTRLQLSWAPDFAEISKDGTLGYTYGRYKTIKPDGILVGEGTYVTIWKKQGDGSWRYVLDTGNEGLSRPYDP